VQVYPRIADGIQQAKHSNFYQNQALYNLSEVHRLAVVLHKEEKSKCDDKATGAKHE
jgi:hypothetical protein